MTNRIAHYFTHGATAPPLDVLSAIELPLQSRRASDSQFGTAEAHSLYFEGYGRGVQQTEDRLRGLHWITLVVGVILGAFWAALLCWLTID